MVGFLARAAMSALCIGAVAAAASGVDLGGLVPRVGSRMERAARSAAAEAGRACLASSACLRAGTAVLAGGTAGGTSDGAADGTVDAAAGLRSSGPIPALKHASSGSRAR